MDKEDDVTHFGYQRVPTSEKAGKVAEVFHSVADRYDIMNDVMSLGTHRVMKKMAANATHARIGHHILDLAGGTGDMAAMYLSALAKSVIDQVQYNRFFNESLAEPFNVKSTI